MNNIKNEFLLPTQIVSGELDNFELIQDKLIDWIYRYKNRNIQSDYKSNCGGWQNRDKNFYTAESFSKYYKIIQKSILDLISEYKFDLPLNINISSMWININPKYAYNQKHTHAYSNISGVFWLKVPENSGSFCFEMPDLFDIHFLMKTQEKHIVEHGLHPCYEIFPKEGSMILFPSYMPHYVGQNLSESDRISIAFNLTIQ